MSKMYHSDMRLYDIYIRELPKSWPGEPVDYMQIVFHVPILARDPSYSREKAVDVAVRHYTEKRGEPGRDNMLEVEVVTREIGSDDTVEHYVRLND